MRRKDFERVTKKDVDLIHYDERMRLANNVRAIRKEKKITQAQLAWYSCTTISSISRIETCSGDPDLYTLSRIATFGSKSFKEMFS